MRTIVLSGFLVLLLMGCKSSDSAAKLALAKQTKDLVENNDFEISLTWANPMFTNEIAQLSNANLLPLESRSGRINLLGTANYVKKRGDSLEIYLPYYGTRQMNPKMGSTNDAIQFIGVPDKYKTVYDEKRQRTEITAEMKEGSERYSIYITVHANQNTTVNVNTTQRTPIKYTGKLTALKEE